MNINVGGWPHGVVSPFNKRGRNKSSEQGLAHFHVLMRAGIKLGIVQDL